MAKGCIIGAGGAAAAGAELAGDCKRTITTGGVDPAKGAGALGTWAGIPADGNIPLAPGALKLAAPPVDPKAPLVPGAEQNADPPGPNEPLAPGAVYEAAPPGPKDPLDPGAEYEAAPAFPAAPPNEPEAPVAAPPAVGLPPVTIPATGLVSAKSRSYLPKNYFINAGLLKIHQNNSSLVRNVKTKLNHHQFIGF